MYVSITFAMVQREYGDLPLLRLIHYHLPDAQAHACHHSWLSARRFLVCIDRVALSALL